MKEIQRPLILRFKCKNCGKVIASLSEGQFEYNTKQHKESCNKKEEKK